MEPRRHSVSDRLARTQGLIGAKRMTYVTKLADGPTELDRVWRLRSQYYDLFMTDYHRSLERLEPVLIEVCRLWMATMLGSKLDLSLRYKAAVSAGLTEAKIKELANYAKS